LDSLDDNGFDNGSQQLVGSRISANKMQLPDLQTR